MVCSIPFRTSRPDNRTCTLTDAPFLLYGKCLILSPTACVVVQWNLVNTVINRPKIFGRNNEVAVLTRVSFQESVWSFLPGGQKKPQ